jgi:hypothetical protein
VTAREPTIAGGLPASRQRIDGNAPVHFTQSGVLLLVLRELLTRAVQSRAPAAQYQIAWDALLYFCQCVL